MQNCSVASHNMPVSEANREGFQSTSPAAPSLRQEAVLEHSKSQAFPVSARGWGTRGLFWGLPKQMLLLQTKWLKAQFTLQSVIKLYSY